MERSTAELSCTPDLQTKSEALRSQLDETLQQKLEVAVKKSAKAKGRPSLLREEQAKSEDELMRAWEEATITTYAAETGDKTALDRLAQSNKVPECSPAKGETGPEDLILPAEVQPSDAPSNATAEVTQPQSPPEVVVEKSASVPVDGALTLGSVNPAIIVSISTPSNSEEGSGENSPVSDQQAAVAEAKIDDPETESNGETARWCVAPSVGTWLCPIFRNPSTAEPIKAAENTAKGKIADETSNIAESATPFRERRARLTSNKRKTPNTRSPTRMSSPAALRVPPPSAKEDVDTKISLELFPAPVVESDVSVKSEAVIAAESTEAQLLQSSTKLCSQSPLKQQTEMTVPGSSRELGEKKKPRCTSPSIVRGVTQPKAAVATGRVSPSRERPGVTKASPKVAPRPASPAAGGKRPAAKVSEVPRCATASTTGVATQAKAASRVSPSRERPGVAKASPKVAPRQPSPSANGQRHAAPTQSETPRCTSPSTARVATQSKAAAATGRVSPSRERPLAGVAKAAVSKIDTGRVSPSRERPGVAKAAVSKVPASANATARVSPSRERPPVTKAAVSTSQKAVVPETTRPKVPAASKIDTGRVSPSRDRPVAPKAKASMSPRSACEANKENKMQPTAEDPKKQSSTSVQAGPGMERSQKKIVSSTPRFKF